MTMRTPDRLHRVTHAQPRWEQKLDVAPSLNAGNISSRAAFAHRCQAYPEIKRAELVEEVVHIPSALYETLLPNGAMLAVLQHGLASPEHAAFVAGLRGRMEGSV